jgi:hypothetical protein
MIGTVQQMIDSLSKRRPDEVVWMRLVSSHEAMCAVLDLGVQEPTAAMVAGAFKASPSETLEMFADHCLVDSYLDPSDAEYAFQDRVYGFLVALEGEVTDG